jgi:pyruvate-formate lyase-activating enzyme
MQRVAQANLVFSVTRRCPLQCAHCITSSGPDVDSTTLTTADAERYARELPALVAAGVRHVTFTGGEPILALRGVEILGTAARTAGMVTSIVTSGAWARSPNKTSAVLDTLACIDHWDLGYDQFHASKIPLAQFTALVKQLQSRGAALSVRACVSAPPSASDEALLIALRGVVGHEVPIYQQSVRRIGRAVELMNLPSRSESVFPEPCLSSGPIIREDGSTGPCCSGLAYERRGCHPFEFGDARLEGLVTCRARWARDPLMRLLRLAGFAVPLKWLAELGDNTLLPGTIPSKTCELCIQLWDREGRVSRYLSERASRPEAIAQIDRLEQELFS